MTSSYLIAPQRIQEPLGIILSMKMRFFLNGEQEKSFHYLFKGVIDKSIPGDHHLSSLVKPRDAKRCASGQINYPTLILMIESYILNFTTPYKSTSLFMIYICNIMDVTLVLTCLAFCNNNGNAEKVHTSKGDYWIKQRFSSIAPFSK